MSVRRHKFLTIRMMGILFLSLRETLQLVKLKGRFESQLQSILYALVSGVAHMGDSKAKMTSCWLLGSNITSVWDQITRYRCIVFLLIMRLVTLLKLNLGWWEQKWRHFASGNSVGKVEKNVLNAEDCADGRRAIIAFTDALMDTRDRWTAGNYTYATCVCLDLLVIDAQIFSSARGAHDVRYLRE